MLRVRLALGLLAATAIGQPTWTHLTSRAGQLPAPNGGTQQTASLIADLDRDGRADFVITERTAAPSVVWFRRVKTGWDKHVIDAGQLRVEAGGAAWDIDGDGDLDLVFGGDGGSNQVWWWENPRPRFEQPWTRRPIKDGGGRKHHDQLIADFDGDGRGELVFWNQGARKLLLAPIPADPKTSGPWPAREIFAWEGGECEGLAAYDVDGDGKLDIVGGGRWFRNAGRGAFEAQVIDDAQRFSRAAVGQLKKGGWAEIVFVIGDGVGRLKWYERAGDAWIGHDLLGVDVVHGHSLQVADIDRDGNLDILCGEMAKWTHKTPEPDHPQAKTWIFYGDGRGKFRPHILSTGIGVHEARVADLDGDGRLDILGKPYTWDAPRVDVWLRK